MTKRPFISKGQTHASNRFDLKTFTSVTLYLQQLNLARRRSLLRWAMSWKKASQKEDHCSCLRTATRKAFVGWGSMKLISFSRVDVCNLLMLAIIMIVVMNVKTCRIAWHSVLRRGSSAQKPMISPSCCCRCCWISQLGFQWTISSMQSLSLMVSKTIIFGIRLEVKSIVVVVAAEAIAFDLHRYRRWRYLFLSWRRSWITAFWDCGRCVQACFRSRREPLFFVKVPNYRCYS